MLTFVEAHNILLIYPWGYMCAYLRCESIEQEMYDMELKLNTKF